MLTPAQPGCAQLDVRCLASLRPRLWPREAPKYREPAIRFPTCISGDPGGGAEDLSTVQPLGREGSAMPPH